MRRTEIVIGGSAGQGAQILGEILAKALVFEGKTVALSSSYGSAVRSGASFSFLVVSEDPTAYPLVIMPTILVLMSEEAWLQSQKNWKIEGTCQIFYNSDSSQLKDLENKKWGVPANQLNQESGGKMPPNIVFLGFVVARTKLCDPESVLKIMAEKGESFLEANKPAFELGLNFKE